MKKMQSRQITCFVVLVLLLLFVVAVFYYHRRPHRYTSLKDLAYRDNKKEAEYTVYLIENDSYIPYLVLSNDYNGQTLLLRRDIMEQSRPFNSYESYYENSLIDHYLNNDYCNMFTNYLMEHVVDTDISITDKGSLGRCGNSTTVISRKFFLISSTELGVNKDNINCGKEGNELTYFKESQNRIAYKNGQAGSWWLRSPDSYYDSCPIGVGPGAEIGFGNASDLNGIRPAFCMEGSLPLEEKSDVIDGCTVYTLKNDRN